MPKFRGDKNLQWFLSQGIRQENGCLEWPHCCVSGYGKVNFRGESRFVHRVVAHLFYKIPLIGDPPTVLHTCDNPKCFEPSHLKIGTQLDNVKDASKKGRLKRPQRKFCKRGHLQTDENVIIYEGRRRCRLCSNLAQQFRRANN